MMKRALLLIGLATTVFQAGTPARAGLLLSGPGAGNNSGFSSTQTGVVGFEFTVGAHDLVVTGLGVLDLDFIAAGNGLTYAHTVSLWNADGTTLLASASVPAGTSAPLVNGFRFVDLATPVTVTAGQNYVVGAYFEDPLSVYANDLFRSNNSNQMQAIFSSDVSFVQGRFGFGAGFPSGTPGGYVGPNLQFSDPTVAVPEPSTVVGGLLGVALLGGCRVRRRSRAV